MNELPPSDGPEWPPIDPAAAAPADEDLLPGQTSFPESVPSDPYSYTETVEGLPEGQSDDSYSVRDESVDTGAPSDTRPYAEAPSPALAATPSYLGNRQDMTAFLAMLAGVASIALVCLPCGGCIPPVFALVAGSIALKDAGLAVNPARARQHAIIGVATGLLLTLGLLVFISLYAAFIGAAIAMSGGMQ